MITQPLQPAAMHILLSLADGERHGYAMMKAVAELSGGAVRMGPGTLYGTVKRLLVEGLIEEAGERPDAALDDARRRYYRLTPSGQQTLQAEVARLEELVRRAQATRVLRPTADPGGVA